MGQLNKDNFLFRRNYFNKNETNYGFDSLQNNNEKSIII